MPLPHTRVTLANGLDVLVHEDHDCPIVAVNIWYHVGSKNEQPGRTGFAHLFEHLMFEGSEHHDKGYFHPLQEAGGTLNGSTNADRTNYWEVVPTNALELALWMESDRMGYLLPALTDQKFQQPARRGPQRAAPELRESAVRLRRHGDGRGAVSAGASLSLADDRRGGRPARHRAGRRARVLPDLLSPAQCVAGACRRRRHRSASSPWWSDYFGSIDAGDPPPPVVAAPPVPPARELRLVLEDRVELPRLYLAWHSAALFADGDAEMDLIAEILAGSKTSRLYRALVYDQRIATEIAASQNSREIGGFFQIVATAAPGRTLEELEAAITRELDGFITSGPTAGGNGALPGPVRVALHLSAADGRRLRRQVRSTERLQRLPRRSRLLRRGPRSLPAGDASTRSRPKPHGRSSPPGASPSASSRAARRARARRLGPGVGGLMPVDRSRLPALGPEPTFTFPQIAPSGAGQRPPGVDRGASRRAGGQRAAAVAGRRCRRSRRPAGARRDYRRSARRGQRGSERARVPRGARPDGREPRHRGRIRRDPARPDHAGSLRGTWADAAVGSRDQAADGVAGVRSGARAAAQSPDPIARRAVRRRRAGVRGAALWPAPVRSPVDRHRSVAVRADRRGCQGVPRHPLRSRVRDADHRR